MTFSLLYKNPRSERAIRTVLTLMGTLLFVPGCPPVMDGGNTNGNTNDNTNQNTNDNISGVMGEVVNILSLVPISELDKPISILYTVTGSPDDTSAFFRPVADGSLGAGVIGADVAVAIGLPSGENQAFFFDPAAAGVGFYRMGILVSKTGTAPQTFLSAGTVEVQGAPNPVFRSPEAAITQVIQGENPLIIFDASDPEGDARWRLFFLPEDSPLVQDPESVPPDQLGTEIAVGAGNAGSATFLTGVLVPGGYVLGVSATDSGSTIAETVDAGRSDLVVTVIGPTIEVLAP